VGRVLVSRAGNVGWTVSRWERCPTCAYQKAKRCYFIKTAAQWPWKSASAKKCVTT